jgi:serine/threonine-protein kinase HipA
MHLKNFSMINKNNSWDLAPAYDLLNVVIVNPEDKEELALTIDAKKSKINRALFAKFGESLGLSNRQIHGTFNRLIRNKKKALRLIDISFLSEKYKQDYRDLLGVRYDRIKGDN